MSKVVNLARARKGKARAEKAARGTANAAKFGRSKAEKTAGAMSKAQSDRYLDGHKRDET